MSAQKPLSLQAILKQRQQQEIFVGREEQLKLFSDNFALSLINEQRYFIFSISGQGGVGKTWLLKRFRQIAEQNSAVVAWADETLLDVPAIMAAIAEQYEQQGFPLKTFSDRYRVYRQRHQELEADPEAPSGFFGLMGRTIAKGSLRIARTIPVAGVAIDLLDEDAAATQVSEWASYVGRKLGNKDEVLLVREPLDVLTPLFVKDLASVAEKRTIAWLFDTYERTDIVLEQWLLDLLAGRYGEVPANIVIALAGREELDRTRWRDVEGVIARFSLEPFTVEEAQVYLTRKDIADERVVEVILSLSGRLPLLIGILADSSPSDPSQVGDPSGTAVERFLKWEDNARHRQVALDAALPRVLDRDTLAVIVGDKDATALFAWLKDRPFVKERADGWVYHEVVREQMLRQKRRESPQGFSELHGRLAQFFEQRAEALGIATAVQWRDPMWQDLALDALYHRFCQSPHKYYPKALAGFLSALKARRSYARRWAETLLEAERDTAIPQPRWRSTQFIEGLRAYDEDRFNVTVEMLTTLLREAVDDDWKAVALAWRGNVYWRMKRYEEALADFTRALELDPSYSWAFARRGMTYGLMKRYEEALADFTRTLELDPTLAWVLGGRGQTYHSLKRYEEALADFTRALELNSSHNSVALGSRGQAYHSLKRYEEALADFTRALELDPTAWAVARRGETYRLMERYEEALADFTRALELDPTLAWAVGSRGQTYHSLKRYEEALADFTRALELDPSYSWAVAHRGETYRLMERYEEALADFTRALELDPTLAWAVGGRGQTYHSLKRYEEALADFTRTLELNPTARAVARRGETYRLMERYEEALADFTRALELNPTARALGSRGQTYHSLKRYEEALADFTRALELNPTARAVAHRGETYRLMERYEEGLADFTRALELNPSYSWAVAHRGETYRLMERYEEGLADFTRALELDPTLAWAVGSRGQAYHSLKRYEEALADFTRALELDPTLAWAVGSRGQAYHSLKRYEEGLADFTRALELDANNDWWFYQRALTYQVLHSIEEAQAGLAAAIRIAQDAYATNQLDWQNTFNLALYHVVAGSTDSGEALYRQAIAAKADDSAIRDAIDDLQDFLMAFPEHVPASAMLALLRDTLSARA